MAKKVYDVVAVTGAYMKDGEQKKRYKNCGLIFENDYGLSLKLECIPAGNEWNGFFSLFEPRDRQAAPARAPTAHADPDDAIPF